MNPRRPPGGRPGPGTPPRLAPADKPRPTARPRPAPDCPLGRLTTLNDLITVSAVLEDGTRTVVPAAPTPADGLVVHEVADIGGWALTHWQSGYRIGRFPSPMEALCCARDLAPVADWTRPAPWEQARDAVAVILDRWHALPQSRTEIAAARHAPEPWPAA